LHGNETGSSNQRRKAVRQKHYRTLRIFRVNFYSNMAMKIALTLPSLPLSGVGTSVGIIEAGLAAAGHDVDVVVTDHGVSRDLEYAKRLGWNLVFPGRGVRFLPHRLKRVLEWLNANGYSAVINNTSMETQLILPCLRPEILRVGVLRGLNPEARRHLSINSGYLHAAVAISAEMVRVMAEDANIRAPVRLIPNCTRVEGGEFPKLDEPLTICFVGRLSNRDKNVSILPRVAAALKASGVRFTLEIVGDGAERKALEKDFREVAPGCATINGTLPRERTQDIMSRSHFVMLPSISEGLSNVLLEGMALGCIPICSAIENFKWVLGDAAERLQCSTHDPGEYARRMIRMSSDPDLYRSTQQYLRERQQSLFTPERTVGGYLELIGELKNGAARELPPSCAFTSLRMPAEYRLYCSPVWRLLQKTRDALTGRDRDA